MPLTEGHKANFNTLQKAFHQGDVALMECQLAANDEKVAVVCAANSLPNGEVEFVPFAMLFNGNPFDLLIPPTRSGA